MSTIAYACFMVMGLTCAWSAMNAYARRDWWGMAAWGIWWVVMSAGAALALTASVEP